jgi:putative transport protein
LIFIIFVKKIRLMATLIEFLLANKVLLLFGVVAMGYFLGNLQVRGFGFGVAAVLFVGLAFGALHPDMHLPDVVYSLGLILFVYTIGLRSGASFFASFRRSGWRDNLFVAVMLCLSTVMALLLGKLFGLNSTLVAGLFCGALTNTPALAGVIDILKHNTTHLSAEQANLLLAQPVVGYSLAYPLGVMGVILVFHLGLRWWKIDMAQEQKTTGALTGHSGEEIVYANYEIQNPEVDGSPASEVLPPKVSATMIQRKGKKNVQQADYKTLLFLGDILTVEGEKSKLEGLEVALGPLSTQDLTANRQVIDYRRVFVSNSDVIGKPIRKLGLRERFGAVITRLRRGDIDMVVNDDMIIEAGDRVRVTAPRENLKAVSQYLGDSYHHLSEVDYISISIGITLGLLLGAIPFPLPGGTSFKLGFAAGPLIVGLLLGKIARTGKIVWIMSYSANFTLRQMGAVLFLAGIGLKAGYSFFSTFQQSGLELMALGAVITFCTALITMVCARLILKMPFNLIMGMMAAMHTQPACLAFANEKDNTGAANISYATVFPTSMILKIILAQVILAI